MHNDKTRVSLFEDLNGHAEKPREGDQFIWSTLSILFIRHRLILGVTGIVAVAAIIISLLLPVWYAASARVLAPESGGSGSLINAFVRNRELSSAAAAVLGGTSGDYARYLTILTSRRMYESVVDTFNLVEVYETQGKRYPREAAIELLTENVSYPVDEEYEYLSVEVMDTDPRRAAEMANFIVRQLNEINTELSSQSAGTYREYVERRHQQALADIDSVMNAVQRFQQEYGVFDLPAQAEGFFDQLAQLRADAIGAEIKLESVQEQLGPDNPQVQLLEAGARAANAKYQNALAGQEALLPVPKSEMSTVMRQYVDLQREATIQGRILEVIRPLLEQARFDEQRKVEALQIVDPAVPPVKKAAPKRSIIVVVATLSAFLLAIAYVLLLEWWRRRHAYIAFRLQQAVEEQKAAHTEVRS